MEMDNENQHDIVVGLDLGTTFSCMAYEEQSGRFVAVPTESGAYTTPSWIGIREGHFCTGQDAIDQAFLDGASVVYDLKRIIGLTYEEILTNEKLCWPFQIINQNNIAYVVLKDQIFKAEQLTAVLLHQLKRSFEQRFGPISNCVITIPAYFGEHRRNATLAAAKIAGLNVTRLLTEPSAAAIAYYFDKTKKKSETVLVYDMGGGTFDVTILNLDEDDYEVKSTAGDSYLGGRDFDEKIVDMCIAEMEKKWPKISDDVVVCKKLRIECEKAKRKLSSPNVNEVKVILSHFNGNDNFEMLVTKECFENMCHDLFLSSLEVVKCALSQSRLKRENIDQVLLVGGSTRIPKIRVMLRDYFGDKCNISLNPDEAIAKGAAIFAKKLTKTDQVLFNLTDVTPRSLGVKSRKNNKNGMYQKLIFRNQNIPCDGVDIFTTTFDNLTEIKIDVYEGEKEKAIENKFLTSVILNIDPQPAREPKIEVTFSLDENGILDITAKDMKKGTQVSVSMPQYYTNNFITNSRNLLKISD